MKAWIVLLLLTASSVATGESLHAKDILSDPRRLGESIDRIVTNRMQEFHVPGAVVTVVRGSRVIFNKGYGFANLEERRPVDPEKTLFAIGSVSKVFNAMAAMTLVDKGLIGADEDVGPRLSAADFELDKTLEGPITLKALLTHTAGIRDLFIRDVTITKDPANVLPLRPYLQKCLPLRWQDPGETVLYTDHGATLAGYVVEVVSRTKFEDYVQSTVMRPLRMKQTCYTVSDKQRPYVAVAYSHGESGYKPSPFLYTSATPAMGVFTTGSDMGRLMIAHLSGCKGLLKPQTAKLMHEIQHSDDPRLGVDWTCGFVRMRSSRSEPYLFHFGGALGVQATVGLSLRRGIGVFVGQNRPGQRVFDMRDLLDALLAEDSEPQKLAKPSSSSVNQTAELESIAGTYVLNRHLSHQTGLERNEQNHVHVRYIDEIKGIEVEYWQTRDNPMRLIQIAPLLFQSVNGEQRLSFLKSKDCQTTWLIDYNFRGDGAFKRISHVACPVAQKP